MKNRILILLVVCTQVLAGCKQPTPSEPQKSIKHPPHLVLTQQVAPETVNLEFERTGTLKYRKQARIFTQEAGQLLSLPWYEGDQVQTGQLLALLDDRLLHSELAKASASKDLADRELARIRALLAKGAASKDELQQALTARDIAEAEHEILQTRLGYMRITAPFSGLVTQRLAEPGDVLERNSQILTLGDQSSLITEVAVSELLLPGLSLGSPVEIRIDALGAQVFAGRVSRIHPEIQPASRMGTVEISLEPVPQGARAGQFVRTRLHSGDSARLMIPFATLKRDLEGEFVYLLKDGKAARQPVVSGIKMAERIEIISGLAKGDTLIVGGFLGISPGKEVVVQPPENNKL